MKKSSEENNWNGEYLTVDGSQSFQQGDIVKFRKMEAPWQKWGIIVTADCDIDKNKHRGILSYVPIIELHDYWKLFTLPKQLLKAESAFLEQLLIRVRSIYQRDGKPADLGIDSIHAMIMGASDSDILRLLKIPPDDIGKWTDIFLIYRRLKRRDDEDSIYEVIKLIADTKTAMSGDASNRTLVMKDIERTVESLPGDAFFISRLPDEVAQGYVAYLRLVRELDSNRIAVIAKDLSRDDVIAQRVGRIISPFLYRLTQQLAQVFSDIGLPSEYEKDRLYVANLAKANLVKNIGG